MADITELQKKLGADFSSPALLEQALVHSSYINENPKVAPLSNERLEFLGDAVLELVVAEKLYQECDASDEGQLTVSRAALVRREALADVAKRISLGNYLYLGKGEEAGGGRSKMVNLACAMEAVIGALYLDKGWEVAREVLLKLFKQELAEVVDRGVAIDYKSRLQEVLQAQKQITPSYHVVSEAGPDHDKVFTVEVRAGSAVLGIGSGKSKKMAEIESARLALQQLPNLFTH